MTNRFSTTAHSIIHTCSDFGAYFLHLKRACHESGSSSDCEGGPTIDEARSDYRRMNRPHTTTLTG